MVKIGDLCYSCMQIISNPICPECFSKEIQAWIRDKNLKNYELKNINNELKILTIRAQENPSETPCILCGFKRVNLCTHCFTIKAGEIVKRNLSSQIYHKFQNDFNTKIWRVHNIT